MAIPLAYNWRNLFVRWTTTILTAAGIALTVAVLLAVLALVDGLRHSFDSSGHALNLLVTRKGATAEITSILTPAVYQRLRARPGIAKTPQGEPMASLELVTGLAQPKTRQRHAHDHFARREPGRMGVAGEDAACRRPHVRNRPQGGSDWGHCCRAPPAS